MKISAKSTPTVVLVHGSWHGSWCWNKIIPLLTEFGISCMAVDLPGHYPNDTSSFKSITLNSYTDYLCGIIEKFDGPVVLLGHSMGGIIISQVAEYISNKIEKLIYLAAFLPTNNLSLLDLAEHGKLQAVPSHMLLKQNENRVSIDLNFVDHLFYHLCDKRDIDYAKNKISDDPLIPLSTKVKLSDDKFGKIPKAYIECLFDRAITHDAQRMMHSKHACRIEAIESDHSPFFSKPKELAMSIANIVYDT